MMAVSELGCRRPGGMLCTIAYSACGGINQRIRDAYSVQDWKHAAAVACLGGTRPSGLADAICV